MSSYDDCAAAAASGEDMVALKWGIWTTMAGKEIDICDMTDSHLSNARRMVARNNPDSSWIDVFDREIERRALGLDRPDKSDRPAKPAPKPHVKVAIEDRADYIPF